MTISQEHLNMPANKMFLTNYGLLVPHFIMTRNPQYVDLFSIGPIGYCFNVCHE